MEHLTARDGTRIAYRAGGEGEPVLFVHGALASSSDWAFVVRLLRDRYTTVTMDRRGRGQSDLGTEPYSIAQEAEDIAAVAEATGARKVVAHSYGGLCTMTALERGMSIDRLVLYEPPVSAPRGTAPQRPELGEALRAGRHEEAVAGFLAAAGATEAELALVRDSPAWPGLVEAAPSLRRELGEVGRWKTPPGPFEIPALLILGADTTSPVYLDGVGGIEAAFPHLRREELADQRHLGHVLAADRFAALVGEFLGSD